MRKEAMSGLGIVRASDFVRKMTSGYQFGQGTEMKGRFKMKKLMIAAGAALCAAVGFSEVSSGVVGYLGTQVGEVSGSIDVGVSFANLGTADGSFIIKDKVFNLDAVDGNAMLIFNPNAYNYDWYQYMPNGDGTGMIWQKMDMGTYETVDLESVTIKNGDAVELLFIDGDLSVAGQVADLKSASRVFNINMESSDFNDWYFPITNPYPIATTKKMLEDFVVDGDAMLVWSDANYNYNWYQYMPNGEGDAMIWQIMDTATGETVDIEGDDDVVLPAGHGGILIPAIGGTRVWTVSLQD